MVSSKFYWDDKYLDLAKDIKKAMEHEGESDTH